MNKNINVINENLWLVNFEYIKRGLIPELKNITVTDEFKLLTREGILLLNDKLEEVEKLYPFYDFVMDLKDDQLKKGQAFKAYIAEKHNPNAEHWNDDIFHSYVEYRQLEHGIPTFNAIAETERIRRKQWSKSNPLKAMRRKWDEFAR